MAEPAGKARARGNVISASTAFFPVSPLASRVPRARKPRVKQPRSPRASKTISSQTDLEQLQKEKAELERKLADAIIEAGALRDYIRTHVEGGSPAVAELLASSRADFERVHNELESANRQLSFFKTAIGELTSRRDVAVEREEKALAEAARLREEASSLSKQLEEARTLLASAAQELELLRRAEKIVSTSAEIKKFDRAIKKARALLEIAAFLAIFSGLVFAGSVIYAHLTATHATQGACEQTQNP